MKKKILLCATSLALSSAFSTTSPAAASTHFQAPANGRFRGILHRRHSLASRGARQLMAFRLSAPKNVFSFAESAYQTLPDQHPIAVRQFDPATGHKSMAKVPVSPMITKQARSQGIDPLIIEIIIEHESAFRWNASSGVGARGLMQLMPSTAAEMGFKNLRDPAVNVAAGTRYFVRQYRQFCDLYLALAAYNAGPGSVHRYGGVPPYEETIHYVYSIAHEYMTRRKLAPPPAAAAPAAAPVVAEAPVPVRSGWRGGLAWFVEKFDPLRLLL